MRVTTRAVFQMTDDGFIELERESYEHAGEVAEAKGGGGSNTTTVQNADPWGPLQGYIKDMLPGFTEAAANIAPYYPGQSYAGFDPAQEAGMQGMMDYAYSPMLNQSIGNQFNALNQGLNATDPSQNMGLAGAMQNAQQYSDPTNSAAYGAAYGDWKRYRDPTDSAAFRYAHGNAKAYRSPWRDPAFKNARAIQDQANSMVDDPYADPTLKAWLGAAQRPLTESYENTVGNAIAGNAAGAGGLGGSRQGVAEGGASGNYMDAMSDLSANTYNNAFNRALGQQMQAGQLVGNTWGQAAGLDQAAANNLASVYGQGAQLGQGAAQNLASVYGQGAMLDQNAMEQLGSQWGDAMSQQARMQALAPSVMQAGMLPYDIMNQVGGAYQGMNQNAINDAMNRYNYDNNIAFSRGTDYFNTLMGQGYGTSTTTGPNPNQSNQFASGLGGAALGLGLGQGLFPAGSAFGAGPAGIGLGPMGMAGIGLLGGLFG